MRSSYCSLLTPYSFPAVSHIAENTINSLTFENWVFSHQNTDFSLLLKHWNIRQHLVSIQTEQKLGG